MTYNQINDIIEKVFKESNYSVMTEYPSNEYSKLEETKKVIRSIVLECIDFASDGIIEANGWTTRDFRH